MRRAEPPPLPSLCLAPWPPRPPDMLPRRLMGINELCESLLLRLRVDEPPPGKLLEELPPPLLVSSRLEPLLVLVRFPNELLDRLRVNLRFWALAAPGVRPVRRAGMWSAEETREMIPADSYESVDSFLRSSLQLLDNCWVVDICCIMFRRIDEDKPLPCTPPRRPRALFMRLTLLSRLFIICLRRKGLLDELLKSMGAASKIPLLELLSL
mmetsp:Transcript_8100/g.19919  ORF Transcript_8100/g.19919 Transcript_8100/m.19919 type:complete len:211 (+) Transcript_8100:415-1047(+)